MYHMMRRFALFFSLLAAMLAHAGEVGFVTGTADGAYLLRGDTVYALEEGIALDSDDLVTTPDDGFAQIEMLDGSALELGPSSQVHIPEYRLDLQQNVDTAEASLLDGWMRFIAAKLLPSRTFRITTPTMVIGIRGTQGVVSTSDDDSSLSLTEGEVEVSQLDLNGVISRPERVRSGQYIERRQGQIARLLARSPDKYWRDLPPRLGRPLIRKLGQLNKRGIALRKLRKADMKDIERILRSNPYIRDRLLDRFKNRFSDPEFRQKFQDQLRDNPGLKNRLYNSTLIKEKLRNWLGSKARLHHRREQRDTRPRRQQ